MSVTVKRRFEIPNQHKFGSKADICVVFLQLPRPILIGFLYFYETFQLIKTFLNLT